MQQRRYLRLGVVAVAAAILATFATPVQAIVGATRKVALLPFGVFAATVNRGTSLLRKGASTAAATASSAASTAAETAREGVQTAARTAGEAAETAVDTVARTASDTAGAVSDSAATVAGTVAEGAQSAAQTVSNTATSAAEAVGSGAQTVAETTAQAAETTGEAVEGAARATEQATQTEVEQVLDLTEVDEEKPPFAGYASLSGDSVMRHVRDSEDVEHLREILAFEQAHKNRKGVVGALNERLTELAVASA